MKLYDKDYIKWVIYKLLSKERFSEKYDGVYLYGYILKANEDFSQNTIFVDPDDRLIGKNSFYARLVKPNTQLIESEPNRLLKYAFR